MEATKGIGQKYRKQATEDYLLFDSWLYSKESTEYATEVGTKLVDMIKTNTKGLCKDKIDNLTKDWQGSWRQIDWYG